MTTQHPNGILGRHLAEFRLITAGTKTPESVYDRSSGGRGAGGRLTPMPYTQFKRASYFVAGLIRRPPARTLPPFAGDVYRRAEARRGRGFESSAAPVPAEPRHEHAPTVRRLRVLKGPGCGVLHIRLNHARHIARRAEPAAVGEPPGSS